VGVWTPESCARRELGQFAAGLTAGDPATTAAMDATPAIRDAAAAVAVAWAVHATDLKRIIPVAIFAIGLLLALVLRSAVAPLYLIASVGISYLAALGLAVIAFVKIAGDGGLVFFMPFLMFIFLPSWSGPCWCPRPSSCSGGGTGGRRG
jgi:putative drug exporter of the RND superfamily